ncbi:MAG TPA: hypothetical protein VLW54_03340 [Candidatus Acidoferrales bacterium]|nr:hypothetical protein [Candidatus Acidoferrales bacterium]
MAGEQSANQKPGRVATGIALLLLLTCVLSLLEWRSLRNGQEELRKIEQLQARAYVAVKGAEKHPKPGDAKWAEVTVTSINTGRTPALNGQFEYILEHRDTPVPEGTVMNQRDWSGHKTVFPPSLEITKDVGMIETGAGSGQAGAASGEYVYGLIEYDDVFQVHHWTKFCFVQATGAAEWRRCATFNAAE